PAAAVSTAFAAAELASKAASAAAKPTAISSAAKLAAGPTTFQPTALAAAKPFATATAISAAKSSAESPPEPTAVAFPEPFAEPASSKPATKPTAEPVVPAEPAAAAEPARIRFVRSKPTAEPVVPAEPATAAEPAGIRFVSVTMIAGISSWNDQGMRHKPFMTKRQKGGAKNLNQAAARQAREDAGVVDDVVVNLGNVHNEVEADIVTVRNRETSKARMAKFRANRKRAAAANVAPPTAAALPSGKSAFSLKQNGEPRKTAHAAERITKAVAHGRCSAAQQGEAMECALNQVHCRGLLEDRGLAAPEASRLAADIIIGNVSKTLERVQSSKAGPLTKGG
ncbi:hypothetical protein T492DRAFT_886608, partial [Pavlovales sp. CCMP2436]